MIAHAGGTLIECRNALVKKGATKVSAYVTHAIFPCDSWRKFTGTYIPPNVLEKAALTVFMMVMI